MDKRTTNSIKKYVSSVAQNYPNFVTAYVFGSFAKNKQGKDSDIDIAIVIDNLPDSEKFDKQVQCMIIASNFDTRIEPHVLSRQDLITDNPFVYEIIKTGIEIK
ncbi:MAG TPA: nucleotidyltransferase domain-containing protein [Bacteroidales bacterium]|nr:MAG: Nucleotidyltransferase domain protein [Bacteroidetes bacterium ADurb.Bin217]HOS83473.1 nucleotidyltransferase domain-containing protein [Bacteroidales bacterium]HPH15703.1 nucleotidyltransferase domain-containing protein [Bacteroidales bacterium]HPM13099.1 nucleotidyltransferase domain-containing protein [Bacteroidales bacterium]